MIAVIKIFLVDIVIGISGISELHDPIGTQTELENIFIVNNDAYYICDITTDGDGYEWKKIDNPTQFSDSNPIIIKELVSADILSSTIMCNDITTLLSAFTANKKYFDPGFRYKRDPNNINELFDNIIT